ncbi:MAG: hypothetical protein WDZ47_12845 [Bacteroidales bacterium]
MKKINLVSISNYTILVYLIIWIYYAGFNWDVFSIKLNTNAGFSVIGGYPFIFFLLLGLAALLLLRYFVYINKVNTEKKESNSSHRIAIMEKDIELLKMKEVLFKMQTAEMDKNSSHLSALHEKLDSLSNQMSEKREEGKEDKEQNG